MGAWLNFGILSVIFGIVRSADLYPYGEGVDTSLDSKDDSSSGEITLSSPFVFYGTSYTTMWINTNGPITFEGEYTDYTEEVGPIPPAYLAAFWDDIDIEKGGTIYHRETTDAVTLADGRADVLDGGGDIQPALVVVVTWDSVQSFYKRDVTNTFQVVMITDGVKSYVMFNYKEINWAHRGVAALNKGGDSTVIMNLEGISGVPGKMMELDSYSNICNPGRVMIRTDPDALELGSCCSMTKAGLIHTFKGVVKQISSPSSVLYLVQGYKDVAQCPVKTYANIISDSGGVSVNTVTAGVSLYKTAVGLYYVMESTRVVQKGGRKGVATLPSSYPNDGSINVLSGSPSNGYHLTSKKCSIAYYYGPASADPVLKIFFGGPPVYDKVTGECV